MPTAPSYQRQQVDSPFPNIRVSAAPNSDTFGGQIGDTVAKAGVAFYDLQTKHANQTAVFEADRKLAEAQSMAEDKLATFKGKRALGADDQLMGEFDTAVQALEDGMANDQQKGAFRRIYHLRREQFRDSVQKHVRTEFSAFQDNETTLTLDSARDRTRRNPDAPLIIDGERKRALGALKAWAERKGLAGDLTPEMLNDPRYKAEAARLGLPEMTAEDLQIPGASTRYESEAYKQERQKVESGLHRQVVEGLLAKEQDQAAKAYAEKNRGSLTAPDLEAIEKHVLEGSTRGESRRTAQALIEEHGMDTPDQRRAVISAINKMDNDKVADLTRQRVEHEFATFDKRREEEYTKRFLLSSKLIEDRGLKDPKLQVRDIIPAPLWNELKPDHQHALELHLGRMREPAKMTHDPKTWFQFESLTNEQLAKVKGEDLMAHYLVNFDGTHYDRALAQWSAARNASEKADDKSLSALTHKERIMNAWKDSGLVDNSVPVSKWTAEQDTWFHRFESEADKALSALPKDAKPEEIQKVLTGLSDTLLKQKYRVDPGLLRFNKDVPAIGLLDQKDPRSIRIPLADVPVADQETIKGLLKTAGMPVTNDKVERIAALKKMQRGGQMSADAMKLAVKQIILE